MLLTITDSAKNHFRSLLKAEEGPMNLRVYAANPGTQQADIGMTFCPQGEEESTDIPLHFEGFSLFIDKPSEAALKDAFIDFEDNAEGGGQLSIKAPHLKGHPPESGSPLNERLQYVLDSEISPSLAGHGGRVSLVEILEGTVEGREGSIVVLQFGGGCQGCGMAHVTLKQGIEKTLKEKFPEIVEVRDATEHALGENPYY